MTQTIIRKGAYRPIPCPNPWGPPDPDRLNKYCRKGVIYERAAHIKLARKPFFDAYFSSVGITYFAQSGQRAIRKFAEVDAIGIRLEQGEIYILEMKLNHSGEGQKKLKNLYYPLISALFGGSWTYYTVEVCRHYYDYGRKSFGALHIPRLSKAVPDTYCMYMMKA